MNPTAKNLLSASPGLANLANFSDGKTPPRTTRHGLLFGAYWHVRYKKETVFLSSREAVSGKVITPRPTGLATFR
jgi:hypothetical protein